MYWRIGYRVFNLLHFVALFFYSPHCVYALQQPYCLWSALSCY